MKAYITKWTLSNGPLLGSGGIIIVDGYLKEDNNSIFVVKDENGCLEFYGPGDWHPSEDSALESSEKKRLEMIRRREKEIKELKNIKFKFEPE